MNGVQITKLYLNYLKHSNNSIYMKKVLHKLTNVTYDQDLFISNYFDDIDNCIAFLKKKIYKFRNFSISGKLNIIYKKCNINQQKFNYAFLLSLDSINDFRFDSVVFENVLYTSNKTMQKEILDKINKTNYNTVYLHNILEKIADKINYTTSRNELLQIVQESTAFKTATEARKYTLLHIKLNMSNSFINKYLRIVYAAFLHQLNLPIPGYIAKLLLNQGQYRSLFIPLLYDNMLQFGSTEADNIAKHHAAYTMQLLN